MSSQVILYFLMYLNVVCDNVLAKMCWAIHKVYFIISVSCYYCDKKYFPVLLFEGSVFIKSSSNSKHSVESSTLFYNQYFYYYFLQHVILYRNYNFTTDHYYSTTSIFMDSHYTRLYTDRNSSMNCTWSDTYLLDT